MGIRGRLSTTISFLVTLLLASTNVSALNVTGTITDGIFSAASPACVAPVVCSGQGTNTFSWGAPLQIGGAGSELQATGVAFNDLLVGTQFVIGHLRFSNAELIAGTEATGVHLQLRTGDVFQVGSNTPDAARSGVPTFLRTLNILNTPNTNNPQASADIIQLVCLTGQPCPKTDLNGNPVRDLFGVLEGQTTSVELLGALSSLDLIGFGKVDDPTKGFVSSTPEPSTLALVSGGLIYALFARHKKSWRRHRRL